MAETKRGFKGVWIPAELWLTTELTMNEKVLYVEINSLDNGANGCFASNAHLAEFLGTGTTTVTNGISKFKGLGLVSEKAFNGRWRRLKTHPERLGELPKREPNSLTDSVRLPNKKREESNNRIERDISKDKTSSKEDVYDVSDETPGPSPLRKLLARPERRQPLGRKKSKGKPKLKPRAGLDMLSYDEASGVARRVVDHWNENRKGADKKPHKPSTNIVGRSLWLLDNGVLKKHGEARVRRTIDDYFMMLKNGSYRVPGGMVALREFFEMGDYQKKLRRDGGHTTKTWFRQLVVPGACMTYFRGDNEAPELVTLVKARFVKSVLREEPEGGWNARQEANFVRCANRLRRYIDRGRMDGLVSGMKPEDHVRVLFEALADQWEDGFGTGNLASAHTFSEVLPRYITANYEAATSPEIVYEVVPDDGKGG